jgi:hypothetical protein
MLITFSFEYPISRTMAFEKEYHPNLRFSLRQKRQLLKDAIKIWMFDHGRIVGESYGVPLNRISEIPEGCPRDPESIYCYSTTILSRYQGRGYGKILKAAFIFAFTDVSFVPGRASGYSGRPSQSRHS